MPVKWLVFFFSTWSVLALIGMGVEQSFAGVGSGGQYTTVINTLMSSRIVTDVTIGGQTVGWLPNFAWFGAVIKAYTFQFSYMQEEFIGWLAYFTLFVPIIIAMIIATLFSVRGSAST